MRLLSFLIASLLGLFGYHGPRTTSEVHTRANGIELLHSKAVLTANDARFQCISSASGQCHYAVFVPLCTNPLTGSLGQPCPVSREQEFVVAAGAELHTAPLRRDSRVCVDRDAFRSTTPCDG